MKVEGIEEIVVRTAHALIAEGIYPSVQNIYLRARGDGGPSREAVRAAVGRLKNRRAMPRPEGDVRQLASLEGHAARRAREAETADAAQEEATAATEPYRHDWTEEARRSAAILRKFRRLIGRKARERKEPVPA